MSGDVKHSSWIPTAWRGSREALFESETPAEVLAAVIIRIRCYDDTRVKTSHGWRFTTRMRSSDTTIRSRTQQQDREAGGRRT